MSELGYIPELVQVKDLRFDSTNPRLVEYDIAAKTPDHEIIRVLWDAMDVRELVQSISASGFFSNEAIIVTKEKGGYVVIEGNRRLAALKLLLDPSIAKKIGIDIPSITQKARKQLEEVPAFVSTRADSWKPLGFKHVNGPQKWSSYAKAAYIASVHRDYKVPLDVIADQIGDGHNTVQRLYRGLMVLEQAEREKVFSREDRFRTRLAFSHLYTGLEYDSISSFLSLAPKEKVTNSPVPRAKIKELGELCVWLYGSKKSRTPPVIESQNPDLKRLNAVIGDREAISALRAGEELAVAFQISRPSSSVFEEALLAAKRELTTAQASLTGGYDKSEALLQIAEIISEMSHDIVVQMDQKRRGGKKKR
jgi:hypothetical protein